MKHFKLPFIIQAVFFVQLTACALGYHLRHRDKNETMEEEQRKYFLYSIKQIENTTKELELKYNLSSIDKRTQLCPIIQKQIDHAPDKQHFTSAEELLQKEFNIYKCNTLGEEIRLEQERLSQIKVAEEAKRVEEERKKQNKLAIQKIEDSKEYRKCQKIDEVDRWNEIKEMHSPTFYSRAYYLANYFEYHESQKRKLKAMKNIKVTKKLCNELNNKIISLEK